jgi:hypothetical protein
MRGGFGDRCDRVFPGLLAIRCSGKEYGLIGEFPARMVGNWVVRTMFTSPEHYCLALPDLVASYCRLLFLHSSLFIEFFFHR